MNLTYEEQERQEYLKGNIVQAELLGKLMEYEQDGCDIDMCLDELNLYGARGRVLYNACCDLARVKSEHKDLQDIGNYLDKAEEKLFKLEALVSELYLIPKLPKAVKEILEKIDKLK